MSKPETGRSIREKWIGWRNGLLADPGFQRFAARFPLMRPVARLRARSLFDLVAGFTYSQTLAACVALDLFERLAPGAQSSAEIASATDLPVAAADRLLRAATALRLVERVGADQWMLGTEGAALRGNPGIAEMVAHHHLLYADLADPVAALRSRGGGQLSGFWHYAESQGQGDDTSVAPYSRLMAASQPLVAQQVIDSYRFARHRRMLDIGGGEGRFLASVGAAAPALELALFDLPAVGDRARQRLANAGLGDRSQIFGGDFIAGPIPQGYDLITLIRVLHDHDDGPALQLLRNIHAALAPGSRLLIAEPMAQVAGAEPVGDAYFGWYLWAMGSGRPRSTATIAAMLKAAGFARSQAIGTPLPITTGMIVAIA